MRSDKPYGWAPGVQSGVASGTQPWGSPPRMYAGGSPRFREGAQALGGIGAQLPEGGAQPMPSFPGPQMRMEQRGWGGGMGGGWGGGVGGGMGPRLGSAFRKPMQMQPQTGGAEPQMPTTGGVQPSNMGAFGAGGGPLSEQDAFRARYDGNARSGMVAQHGAGAVNQALNAAESGHSGQGGAQAAREMQFARQNGFAQPARFAWDTYKAQGLGDYDQNGWRWNAAGVQGT